MNVLTVLEPEVTTDLDAAIRKSLCIAFPEDASIFSQTRAWRGSSCSWSHYIEIGDRIIAYAGVVDRHIKVGNNIFHIAGIQNVFVLPEYRGQNLSDRIMKIAMEEAGHRSYDAGLLFCLQTLEKVYARYGWLLLAGRSIIRIAENGAEKSLPEKNITMSYPLKQATFPYGDIHLQGNDW